ncbi:MAG: FtsX-like permease family protein [Alphaproteobacteria bacterium]|nr:FtsX-like permease family protein [Alphaproteobacteria bacterium]MBU1560428.1 FtsX-like permease family protein [Alphaproteobacteria bacterium]MBU2303753.1 FtsX-like permease family protein [Alphaproteobacteria bacterium]MBU2366352.1 FtsX-like permease family protein [Alphaproteobacteria bacterium]
MHQIWPAIRIGLLDMRGDMRRFLLLVVCLAVGTALIAGVNSVGASITRAIDAGAAELMGGDVELSRADRIATAEELATMAGFGTISSIIDTNVRAESSTGDAFVDLTAVGPTYPLLGRVLSPQLPEGASLATLLAPADDVHGALVDPLLLDQLGIAVGDSFTLGGTIFEARGTLTKLPDGPVRGFRLGLTTLITAEGLVAVSDRSSPLPGLGTWTRYKILLTEGEPESRQAELEAAFADSGWTIRTARDGLGQMVRYYDLFMRFLIIVGLGSLLIGGVSVWTGMQSYIAERAGVIAILRSMGATRARIFIHFFAQVATLAAIGVGIGLLVGGGIAFLVLPTIGGAVGIDLVPALHLQPLLVAAGAGLVTAFAFSYLPLQQAQTIRPVLLFRSKGLAAPPIDWRALLLSWQVLPMVAAALAFFILAWLMTGDVALVAAFGLASIASAIVFRLFIRAIQVGLRHLREPKWMILRHALRAISGSAQNAASVVVSAGMALAMLIVVLVLQANLRQEFLGASAFDAPTLVASDLFSDEVDMLASMAGPGTDIPRFVATPMLRGALTEIAGTPAASVRTRGPEATFLLAGEVPLTFRSQLPESSRVTAGEWWPADYAGPGLVSLHQSLRSGLGVNLGDTLTFTIFGEPVTVEIASFRDYSWQGGIDFLATFSPGVIDEYPTTLFAAATAAPGREEAVERLFATELPDVRFIAIGDTLKQITDALSQLSFAATLVGGLAVGNGLLVLIGSLSTGRRQREADTVITKVLGATRFELMAASFIQYLILAALAALPALLLGTGLGWLVTLVMLNVDFTFNLDALGVVLVVAIAITAMLGALTILRAASARPARLLRDL